MDALVVDQYRWLLAVLAGAALGGFLLAALLGRHLADETPPEPPAASSGTLPWFMLLLVVLVVSTGVLLLLLPVVMILRYFPHGRIHALVIAAALVLVAPLIYAWRARPASR